MQARARYDLHLVDQQKQKETHKSKADEAKEEYVQAKKKLKLLEGEAKSLLAATDKKAEESAKNHDFKILAQWVAMRDKGNETLISVKD